MERRGFLGGLFAGAAGLIAAGASGGMTEVTKKIIMPDDPGLVDAVRNGDDLTLMAAGINPTPVGELASGSGPRRPPMPSGDYDLIDPGFRHHPIYGNCASEYYPRWNANLYQEWLNAHLAVDKRFSVKVF